MLVCWPTPGENAAAVDLLASGYSCYHILVPDPKPKPERRWYQFSLRALLLIFGIYAVMFGWFWHLGTLGITLALICGTTASAVLILIRKKDIPRTICVGVGTVIGALLGAYCLFPPHDVVNNFMFDVAICGAIGGFVASLFPKKRTAR